MTSAQKFFFLENLFPRVPALSLGKEDEHLLPTWRLEIYAFNHVL
jgi:hypothetical protein